MVNCSAGKIYKVLNTVDDQIYVGSTTQSLSKRMGKHRSDAPCGNSKFYKHINDIGVDNFYIELIETYPCNSNDELQKREGEWIRQLGTLNQTVPGRTKQQYREDNKDKIRETMQQYRTINKDKLLEKQQQYKEQRKYICNCVCGSRVKKINMCKHLKTETHKQFIETMEMTLNDHEVCSTDVSTTASDTGSDASNFDLSIIDYIIVMITHLLAYLQSKKYS